MPRFATLVLLAIAVLSGSCQRTDSGQAAADAATPSRDATADQPATVAVADAAAPSRDASADQPAEVAAADVAPPSRDPPAHKPAVVAAADAAAPSRGAPADPPAKVAATPLRDAYHSAPLDTVDARTYQGWKYYNLHCARCHGEDVQGTTVAPHLITSLQPGGPIPDRATFQTTVCDGRVEKGMPAWCAMGVSPEQIDTIYAYVHGRSTAAIHPGRPARRDQ